MKVEPRDELILCGNVSIFWSCGMIGKASRNPSKLRHINYFELL